MPTAKDSLVFEQFILKLNKKAPSDLEKKLFKDFGIM